jgi:hypothetical protein
MLETIVAWCFMIGAGIVALFHILLPLFLIWCVYKFIVSHNEMKALEEEAKQRYIKNYGVWPKEERNRDALEFRLRYILDEMKVSEPELLLKRLIHS